MLRLASLLTLLALASAANAGDEPKKVVPANFAAPTGVIPSSPCPDGACAESAPRGPAGFGKRLRSLFGGPLVGSHECGPDGCINPIGCANFHTDFRFVFGSCRSFFGTAGAIPPLAKP
jgi:hypothetical protein